MLYHPSYIYSFCFKENYRKGKPNSWELNESSFMESSFDPFFISHFATGHIENCFLIDIRFQIDERDVQSTETRYYLIEPVKGSIIDHGEEFIENFFRITLIDDENKFKQLFQYIPYFILDEIKIVKYCLHWIIGLEVLIEHLLEIEKNGSKKLTYLEYRKGKYEEIIINELKNLNYDEINIKRVIIELNKHLIRKEIKKSSSYRSEEENFGFSRDELDIINFITIN